MPRIPAAELEQLKNDVSVQRLVEGAGIELKKSGACAAAGVVLRELAS